MTGLTVFDPFRNLTVGFDNVFNQLSSLNHFEIPKYPPYNIKKIDDNKYQLEIALAGFSREDIAVEVKDNTLTISGKASDDKEKDNSFVYKGIAQRAFKRHWTLIDYLKVINAKFNDGILIVDMELNLPEEEKPKKIEIK
jgi:molecular chaperone IbpA|tara:strand:- start:283 stop:702 length:420 start_codon:yes stop_codon:yes gene_type:complete